MQSKYVYYAYGFIIAGTFELLRRKKKKNPEEVGNKIYNIQHVKDFSFALVTFFFVLYDHPGESSLQKDCCW